MKNGLIIIPTDIQNRAIAPWMEILGKFAQTNNVPIAFADKLDVPRDMDWVLVYGIPQHNRQTVLTESILNIGIDTTVIGWMQDLQTYGMEYTVKEQKALLERFDYIIAYRKEDFLNRFPGHADKLMWIPNWLYNTDLYKQLDFNDRAIPQFTLSGNAFPEAYPFRAMMEKIGHPDVVRFSTFQYNAVEYAKINNMYLGGITCPSKYGTALKKHFEIPGAGGLLISPGCKDMQELGFEHDVNFIDVTKCDLRPDRLIEKYLRRPELCLKIRENGMEFVQKWHTAERRYNMFRAYMNEKTGSSYS